LKDWYKSNDKKIENLASGMDGSGVDPSSLEFKTLQAIQR
jgi:hypothetical protein